MHQWGSSSYRRLVVVPRESYYVVDSLVFVRLRVLPRFSHYLLNYKKNCLRVKVYYPHTFTTYTYIGSWSISVFPNIKVVESTFHAAYNSDWNRVIQESDRLFFAYLKFPIFGLWHISFIFRMLTVRTMAYCDNMN